MDSGFRRKAGLPAKPPAKQRGAVPRQRSIPGGFSPPASSHRTRLPLPPAPMTPPPEYQMPLRPAPTSTPAPANSSRPRLTPAANDPCYTPECRLPSSQRRRPETCFGQAQGRRFATGHKPAFPSCLTGSRCPMCPTLRRWGCPMPPCRGLYESDAAGLARLQGEVVV